MTTNTLELVEEILRLMDDRPDVLEAVRARVLTRELLEMPERMSRMEANLARLEAVVAELVATTRDHSTRLDRLETKVDQLDSKVDQLDSKVDQLDSKVDRLDSKVDQLDSKVNRLDSKVDQLDSKVNRIDGQFGSLKGRDLELNAMDRMDEIAREAGDYTFIERLASNDLYAMHRNADTTGISNDDLKSFRRSDIIMRVEDADGETCYVVVEASYTADDRDTTRAGRNAEFLTRFTGRPAVSVIASVHLDRRIEWIVEADEFIWYEMDEPR